MAERFDRKSIIDSLNPERLIDDDRITADFQARESLVRLCGIRMKDESEAPPIDEEARAKLRLFVRGQLSKEDFGRLAALTHQFRSWAKAELEALKEYLEEQRQN
jgi:hypothetical protein